MLSKAPSRILLQISTLANVDVVMTHETRVAIRGDALAEDGVCGVSADAHLFYWSIALANFVFWFRTLICVYCSRRK